MRMPSPQDFDSDVDYYDACEAYDAYLNGDIHPAQTLFTRIQLEQHNPDSNQFAYD